MFLQNDDGFLFPHCYHYFRFRCYSVEVNFFGLVALVDYFQRTMIGEDYLTIFDLAKKIQKNSWTQKSFGGKIFLCEYFQKIQWNWLLPDDIELWELLDNIWLKNTSTLCISNYQGCDWLVLGRKINIIHVSYSKYLLHSII